MFLRAKDYLVHRNAIGRVEFHHINPTWSRFAVLQGEHPELSRKDPFVKRWLQRASKNLCPEPGCAATACEHNIKVYEEFVRVVNTVDIKKDFLSVMGLSRFVGTQSEYEAPLCTGFEYKSLQLKALFDAGFDYPILFKLTKIFGSPATYLDNARLTPVWRKSNVAKWEIRHHYFLFRSASGVAGPRDIVCYHYPSPPLARSEHWKVPLGYEEDDWLGPLRHHFAVTFDDFDYPPKKFAEVKDYYNI